MTDKNGLKILPDVIPIVKLRKLKCECGKDIHYTRAKAQEALASYLNAFPDEGEMKVYECACSAGHWHFAHAYGNGGGVVIGNVVRKNLLKVTFSNGITYLCASKTPMSKNAYSIARYFNPNTDVVVLGKKDRSTILWTTVCEEIKENLFNVSCSELFVWKDPAVKKQPQDKRMKLEILLHDLIERRYKISTSEVVSKFIGISNNKQEEVKMNVNLIPSLHFVEFRDFYYLVNVNGKCTSEVMLMELLSVGSAHVYAIRRGDKSYKKGSWFNINTGEYINSDNLPNIANLKPLQIIVHDSKFAEYASLKAPLSGKTYTRKDKQYATSTSTIPLVMDKPIVNIHKTKSRYEIIEFISEAYRLNKGNFKTLFELLESGKSAEYIKAYFDITEPLND